MKILKSTFLFLLLTFIITSCDKVDELEIITVDGNFMATINVDVAKDPDGAAQTFTSNTVLNIRENQEINENFSKIEEIRINSLTYQITNAEGNEEAVITNAILKFGNNSFSVSDLNVIASSAAGTKFSVNDSQLREALGAALKNNPQLSVIMEGTVSDSPINFDVIITLGVNVDVDVL